MLNERVVAVIPQNNDSERLVVLLREDEHGGQTVLRQESKASSGWFAQSEIVAAPEQLAGLKLLFSSRATSEFVPERTSRPMVIPINRHRRKGA